MFMSVTCSSKVIFFATLEGSFTTFGLIYGSSNKIWESSDRIRRDNRGKAHDEMTHRRSSIMDHD